jgi:ribosomal protein S12 methylthiotransferase
MPADPVPEDVKQERLARFMDRQAQISAERLEAQGRVGASAAWSTRSTANWRSRARASMRRRSTARADPGRASKRPAPGDFVDVEILGSDEHDLFGETVAD